MLSQMMFVNRASRAANLLVSTQKGLAQANKTGPILGNRIRCYLQNDKTSVKDLVQVYHQLTIQEQQSSLFSLTEEKLLNLLTEEVADKDDIIHQYLPKIYLYDYNSLCHLFIEIANAGRRPTPLIKAASNVLVQTPLTENRGFKPKISTLIATLNALVRLNYTSRPLVTKIISDMTEMINLNDIDSNVQCSLLRSLGGLKWRHEPLMEMFYEFVATHHHDPKKVTPNLIITLLYITANINYKPSIDIKEFYDTHMAGAREDLVDRKSRKWLNYVWSLGILDVADESHLLSVLDDEYIASIENPLGLQRFNHADVMKLLNLRAFAKLEKRINDRASKLLDELALQKIHRGLDLQKFSSRMKIVLNGLVSSDKELRHDIHTPYGFAIDCEVALNQDKEFIPLDIRTTLEDELNFAETLSRTCDTNERKCALIYVLFDEAIANHPDEPVGHKKIIARILRNAGYRTVFLQEGVLNKEKTSSDLALKVKQTITTAVEDEPLQSQTSK